ncbi:MAG TPA: class I tRNA ligase family protein, partial [Gammaproteobacteria bacterium]|nr:class I tRNA ligase family protein [Gammaproteobacteria bacterium]
IEGYRNFCNKLWNAARYALMQVEGKDAAQGSANAAGGRMPGAASGAEGGEVELSLADRWIISRLQRTEQRVREALDGYRLDHAAQALYEFTWHEYCDWYLELSKPVLNDPESTDAQARGTRRTLVRVLDALLRLSHPIMPFLTEEIWQSVAPLAGARGETIMRQPYPRPDPERIDAAAEAEMEWVQEFIAGVRKIRSGMNIAPTKALPVLLQNGSDEDAARLERNRAFLATLARLESITWLEPADKAPEAATALLGEMNILVPLAGLIDKDEELARLDKEIAKLEQDVERAGKKLENPSFVDKAPAEVVQKERDKVADLQSSVEKLRGQRERIERI